MGWPRRLDGSAVSLIRHRNLYVLLHHSDGARAGARAAPCTCPRLLSSSRSRAHARMHGNPGWPAGFLFSVAAGTTAPAGAADTEHVLRVHTPAPGTCSVHCLYNTNMADGSLKARTNICPRQLLLRVSTQCKCQTCCELLLQELAREGGPGTAKMTREDAHTAPLAGPLHVQKGAWKWKLEPEAAGTRQRQHSL